MEPEQKVDKIEADFQPVKLQFAPVWKRMLSYVIDIFLLGLVIELLLFLVYPAEMRAVMDSMREQIKEIGTLFQLLASNMKLPDVPVRKIGAYELFMQSHSVQISIAYFAIQAAYFILGWMARGQTVGARIMKIVVITMDKKKLNFFQGLVRFCIIYLSSLAFYIPLLFVVNPVYRQRVHDALSMSVVVEMPEIENGDEGDPKPGDPDGNGN